MNPTEPGVAMMFIFPSLRAALALIAIAAFWQSALADDPGLPAVNVTLHAQADGVRTRRHRLLYPFSERIQGNAVVYLGMVKSEQNAFFGNRELRDKIDKWQTAPLEELRGQPADPKFNLDYNSGILYYLEQAARCDHADWQLPIGREPYFETLLPAVQESRSFTRILDARARIEIARGEFENAVRDFRINLGLAQHLGANETLVAALVGCAMSGVTAKQLETFIQQPGAPNLHWALTELPRPLIDFRDAVDAEVHGVELSFPETREVDSLELTSEAWRDRLLNLMQKVHKVADQKDWVPTEQYLDEAMDRLLPLAKRYLQDGGLSSETISKMPAEQIILLDLVKRNMELRQEAAQWFHLPYPIASKGLAAIHQRADRQWRDRRDIAPLPQLSAQPLYVCRRAQVRLDRQIAALRVLEALRMHAAEKSGQLPKQLGDISGVPIPNDPVTEEPFEYMLHDDVATLRGPDLADAPLSYVITMAKPSPGNETRRND